MSAKDNRSIEEIATLLQSPTLGTRWEHILFSSPEGYLVVVSRKKQTVEVAELGLLQEESPSKKIFVEPEYSEKLREYRQQSRLWNTIHAGSHEAFKSAEDLAKTYGVYVAVVHHIDLEELSTPKIAKFSAAHDIYFLLDGFNDLNESIQVTKMLLSFREVAYTRWTTKQYEAANAKRVDKANQISLELFNQISEIKTAYIKYNQGQEPSLNKLADLLNEHGIESPSGKTKWYAQTVKRVLERSSGLLEASDNDQESPS